MSELLPTTYYHLVFTLPQELRSLVMGNRTVLFNLLFDAGHHTINTLSADKKWLGAKPGIVSILHTNGQDLSFHLENANRVAVYFLQKNITDTVSVHTYTASLAGEVSMPLVVG